MSSSIRTVGSDSCTLCGAHDFNEVWSQPFIQSVRSLDYVVRICVCNQCSFVFQNPRLSDDELADYYTQDVMYYDWGQLEIPQSSISRYSAVREMLESARTGPGTLLDVGTYTGQFIEYMSQNGWKVHGIEPNIEAAKAGRRAWGHEITVSDTSTAIELLKGRTFDAITFSHVLEHVSDLSEPFRLADLLLSSGGLLFIEVPDMGNMAPDYPGFFSIEHLSHFTIATVEHLAANRGYSVIRSENVSTGPDLDTELPVLRVVLTRTEKARVAQNLTPAELVDPITLSITELNIGRDTLVNKVRRILEEEQESKIAIWGAGFHTSLLLGLIPELSDIAVAIIDSDVRKHGLILGGIEIESSDRAANGEFDCIIISSYSAEQVIQAVINEFEIGTKGFTLYS